MPSLSRPRHSAAWLPAASPGLPVFDYIKAIRTKYNMKQKICLQKKTEHRQFHHKMDIKRGELYLTVVKSSKTRMFAINVSFPNPILCSFHLGNAI